MEACKADLQKDWSSAKSWAQWWTRAAHLQMLSKAFTEMDVDAWTECPMTTNAENRDCKSDCASLKQAMLKVDKLHCLKHIAAEKGSSITYRSQSEEARATEAKKRQKRHYSNVPSDKAAEFGPSDKVTNFNVSSSQKRKSDSNDSEQPTKKMAIDVNNEIVEYTPDSHPELIGKMVCMKFEITESKELFLPMMELLKNMAYNYFPSDQQAVLVTLDDD